MKMTITELRDRKLQEICPNDYPSLFNLYGLLSKLVALHDYDYDAQVDLNLFEQMLEEFPELLYWQLQGKQSEETIKFGIFGPGKLVTFARTIEQAKVLVAQFERIEKRDELHEDNFYSIFNLKTGEEIK